jgi:hypothetical protein
MPEKTMKRCTNPLCFTGLRREVFPAKTTKCPYCQHPVESVTVITTLPNKGGSKSGDSKVVSRAATHHPVGKKPPKKSVKRFSVKMGNAKDVSLKPPARKPAPRKRGASKR